MTRFFRQWLRNVQKVSIRTKLLWPLLALSVGSVGTVGILSMVVAREAISVMAFDQFETVGQDSPVCSRPSKRVVAFDGANSLLYQKLVGTQNCGSQMPAGGPYLNPADSNKFVKAWIDEGALDSSISPQRSTGFRFHNQAFENSLQWSLGYFWGGSDSYGDDKDNDGVNVITGRITGLPIYQEGDMLLHVGMSFSNRHLRGDATEFKSKPMANLAEEYVLTSTSPDDLLLVGFAWQSLHAQLEYVHYDVSAIDGASDATFSGWYLQFGYFLTGETRPYSGKNGMWSRVTPLKNAFGEEGGYGAWEAKARIQMIDGNDDDVTGNELMNFALGVNWYLNSATRVMLEYVFSDLESDAGDIGNSNIVQMRFQIDF